MPDKIQVFISSKMAELAEERQIIDKALDEMMVEAWVFENDAGASPGTIQETYIRALEESDLYLGIFWKGYGAYTVDDEFVRAAKLGIPCLIYEKRTELDKRDPKLQEFLNSISGVEDGLTIQWYKEPDELYEFVKRDIARWQRDVIRSKQTSLKQYSHFAAVPKKFRVSFDALMADKLKNFVGREFVFEAVQEFIDANESGYFIIRGEPGIGKSALMAKMINDNGYIHHFNITTQGINSPGQFLENVIQQLIAKYNLSFGQWPDDATRDSGFFVEVLGRAASNEDNLPIVIAIDALDESDTSLFKPSENVLYLPSYLPPGIFIIATTRPLENQRLNVNTLKFLDIEADSEGNLQDIVIYIEDYLERETMQSWLEEKSVPAKIFIDALKKKSEGNFMYLYHVLPAIESGSFKKGSLDELPNGLLEYYNRHWREMQAINEDDFIKIYEPVVCILGVAKEPVTIKQISNWTKITPSLVNKGLKNWREFLDELPSADGDLFRIYHASFREFLDAQVNLGQYDEMIAQYYLELSGVLDDEE